MGHINIAIASSDLYSSLAIVTLTSLFLSNEDVDEITVYYIGDCLSDENVGHLLDVAQKFQRQIVFLDLPMEYGRFTGSNRNGRTVFSYCFLQDLLPQHVDSVLLLEPDQMVVGSIAGIFATDLSGCLIAAADDLQSGIYKRKIGMKTTSPYVNCGMILYDLKQWREEDMTNRMLSILESGKHMLFYDVQDVINFACEGRVKVLPPKYNAATSVFLFGYRDMVRYRRPSTTCSRLAYDEGRTNPVIVHFTKNQIIQPRPWVEGCQHPWRNQYLRIREKTPMANQPLWEYSPTLLNKLANIMYTRVSKSFTALTLGVVHAWLYPALLYKFMFRNR